jgi:riboflavin synthase
MFTGIVKELGLIESVNSENNILKVAISSLNSIKKLNIDDSVSVNGICLTVTKKIDQIFEAQIIEETISKTTAGFWKPLEKVNLETSLQLNDGLSGHLVQGHVDGIGEIVGRSENSDSSVVLRVRPNPDLLIYIVNKGSITLDGVSLTVSDVDDEYFEVSLIPHTLSATTLGFKDIGELINVEVDVIAKYVSNYMNNLN